MPAHGSFEGALASINALDEAEREEAAQSKSSSLKKQANGTHAKQSNKRKHGEKEGRHSKKKSRKRSRRDMPASSSGGEGSEPEVDLHESLRRGQAAVRIVRELLACQPELAGELRELLHRLDSGEAVDIGGIPSISLKAQLAGLFTNLMLKSLRQVPHQMQDHLLPNQQPQWGPAQLPGGTQPHASHRSRRTQGHGLRGHLQTPSLRQTLGLPCHLVWPMGMPPAQSIGRRQMSWHEDEEDLEDLIGPAPPELAGELESVGGDERSAEVVRVLRLLERPEDSAADAYEVVGLEPSAKAAEIKKRYWRLSLLIHPDKCPHPRAHDAFQAVSKAAKQLQDATGRREVDQGLEDARLRRIAEELAKGEETQRQWRVARGQATAEDLAGPRGPQQRDGWMTELPAARRASATAMMAQKSQTAFSAQGISERGDTSGWTSTPQQRAQMQLQGASASGLALLGTQAYADPTQSGKPVAPVGAGPARKTLVQQHTERLEKQKKQARNEKAAKQKQPATAAQEDTSWVGQHPWRPFDRERDLGIAPKPVGKEELLKSAGSLSGRFGGGGASGAQRSFL
eukprot:jgi/Astpho2/8158/Aster-03090